jgi:hypothetical protein
MKKLNKNCQAIKRNLQYLLNNFKQFEANNLMAIGVSSREGTFCLHYDSDLVFNQMTEDIKKQKQLVSTLKKKNKTLLLPPQRSGSRQE